MPEIVVAHAATLNHMIADLGIPLLGSRPSGVPPIRASQYQSRRLNWEIFGTGTPYFNPLLSARALVQVRPCRAQAGCDPRRCHPFRSLPITPRDWLAAQLRRKQIMTTFTHTRGAAPTHRLYVVTGTGASSSWREIGAAWPNKDGQGFSLSCAAIPLAGRIVMRAISEKPVKAGGQE
jgi:hypothetical protein